MYVVAGATGRVGSAAARRLLAEGAEVRTLARHDAAAEWWAQQGADIRVLDLNDRVALSKAAAGCAGLFVLLPFDLTADDLDKHADAIIDAVAGAVADQDVPHVVMLSSGGADPAEGTGPITGLHRLEEALLATGTVLTSLRPGHFQEKVADVIDVARYEGLYPVFADSADIPQPMVATQDIGVVAAHALQSPPTSSESCDIIGPTYSEREVAAVLGGALGRELEISVLREAAWIDALTGAGFRSHIAEALAELYRADAQGFLMPRGDRSLYVNTPIETTIAGLLAGSTG